MLDHSQHLRRTGYQGAKLYTGRTHAQAFGRGFSVAILFAPQLSAESASGRLIAQDIESCVLVIASC